MLTVKRAIQSANKTLHPTATRLTASGWSEQLEHRIGCRAHFPVAVGELFRSIRMTHHASGWFDRLREADCDGATQETTTTGALSGHGQRAPRISRIATDTRGRLRRVSSVPIRAIRGQNQSGSNQALEPTETRVSVLDMAALASQVSSGLHGSVLRWADCLRDAHTGHANLD
jgi:hypothetical protein